jgi:hypothetical protein
MTKEHESAMFASLEENSYDQTSMEYPGFRLADGCVLARVDGDPVLLTPLMVYLKLDLMGEFIVRCLIGNRNIHEIVEAVTIEYFVDRYRAGQDVMTFIKQLMQHGVIVLS